MPSDFVPIPFNKNFHTKKSKFVAYTPKKSYGIRQRIVSQLALTIPREEISIEVDKKYFS